MRVQASIQFSCAATGRDLETQLSTETRNLVILRRGKVPMRCAFCGRQHYWRLMEYHRTDTNHQPRPARAKVRAEKKPSESRLAAETDCLDERPGKRRRRRTQDRRDKQEAINI